MHIVDKHYNTQITSLVSNLIELNTTEGRTFCITFGDIVDLELTQSTLIAIILLYSHE